MPPRLYNVSRRYRLQAPTRPRLARCPARRCRRIISLLLRNRPPPDLRRRISGTARAVPTGLASRCAPRPSSSAPSTRAASSRRARSSRASIPRASSPCRPTSRSRRVPRPSASLPRCRTRAIDRWLEALPVRLVCHPPTLPSWHLLPPYPRPPLRDKLLAAPPLPSRLALAVAAHHRQAQVHPRPLPLPLRRRRRRRQYLIP